MILIDVNVLVYAFREDAPKHTSCRDWLVAALAGDHPVAIPEVVLSGFVRIVPHPGIFKPPTPLNAALAFAAGLRERVDRLDLVPATGISLPACAVR